MIIKFEEIDKYKNEEIIYTTGCFDLVHSGHVNFLAQAKEKGENKKLMVGIIPDKIVKGMKGDDRPIITALERAKVIDAFRYVDYVFVAPDLPPKEVSMMVVRTINPAYLASTKESWLDKLGELNLEGTGLVLISEAPGKNSTTNIINKIRK